MLALYHLRFLIIAVFLFGIAVMTVSNRNIFAGHPATPLPPPPDPYHLRTAMYNDPAIASLNVPFDAMQAPFSVKFKEEVSPYRLMSAFVLPGDTLEIEPVFTGPGQDIVAQASRGELVTEDSTSWRWVAPDSVGVYALRLMDQVTDEAVQLQTFVMVPFSEIENGYLNGYRIGEYEPDGYRGNPAFNRPRGFIEVTPEMVDLYVSPHFRLRQFLCKQESDWPKYVVLQERLLLKLERLLEEANAQGYRTDQFEIISAYRTPWYNKSIGNDTPHSVHLYGGAADIRIGTTRQSRIGDLNKDGRTNARDARVLYSLVDEVSGETWYRPFIGGLGFYPNSRFIHVDVRGEKVRW